MRRVVALLAVTTLFVVGTGTVIGAIALAAGTQAIQISDDPYTNPDSQHKTQVEPDSFAFGRTIVATFQSGRFFDGGASNVGWSTSTDGGATWTHGFLPGTTVNATPPGIYDRVSDPSVSFDPKRRVWMIATLAIRNVGANDVIINRSTDGGLTWTNPVAVALGDGPSFYDKEWIGCDTTASSPFFGNCYVQWDDAGRGNLMLMSTSANGGVTWGAPKQTANHETGTIGGQPVVLASGKVVVPFLGNFGMEAFNSTDGGNTWSTPIVISSVSYHTPAGGIRAPLPGPSVEVRTPGLIIVAWGDCRFEPSCNANDIVFSTSGNGTSWTPVTRIPLDPIGSGVDHFLPGIAVQPQATTNTTLAHFALGYYFYPVSNCNSSTCRLNVGFSFSIGGANWSPPQTLAGPMQLAWLANTNQGRMVGDYMSTSYSGVNAFPVYDAAVMPNPPPAFNEATFTTQEPAFSFTGPTLKASSAGAKYGAGHQWRPVPGVTTAN